MIEDHMIIHQLRVGHGFESWKLFVTMKLTSPSMVKLKTLSRFMEWMHLHRCLTDR